MRERNTTVTDKGTIKDLAESTTDGEPTTGAQGACLRTLAPTRWCGGAGGGVTRAEVLMKIDELREMTVGEVPKRLEGKQA